MARSFMRDGIYSYICVVLVDHIAELEFALHFQHIKAQQILACLFLALAPSLVTCVTLADHHAPAQFW